MAYGPRHFIRLYESNNSGAEQSTFLPSTVPLIRFSARLAVDPT